MENKIEQYQMIISFIKNSPNSKKVTIFSELVNLLKNNFEYMDWVGFYDKDENKEELFLSYYVGSEACEIIKLPNGVCGRCFVEQKTQLVRDVRDIPYHIACSSSTISEIVVPLFKNGKVVSVLDIDSDLENAFDETDQKYLEEICKMLEAY